MESAQLRLERMLPELRDLEQKKIFTKPEISAIVAQRQIHEAAISRPRSHEPYMQYIDYERRLERLRRLRVGKMVGPQPKAKGRITISDYSIPLHILNLFSSAAKRFPQSRELWMAYITYALSQPSPKLISRVLSAAIAAQPSHPDFWVMAAQFEADGDQEGKGGGNVDGARKLLMRGLRFLKGEDALPVWTEWIRIELNFIQTMNQRQEVLGISNHKSSMIIQNDDSTEMDPAVQTTMDLDQLGEEPEPSDEMSRNLLKIEDKGQRALQSGALVQIILSNAFKSIQSLSIFHETISLLNAMELPIKSTLLDFTYSELEALHPEAPQARVMIITRDLFSSPNGSLAVSGIELVNAVSSAIKKIQSVCKELAKPEMWEEFLNFLVDLHTKLTDEDLCLYVSLKIKKTISLISSNQMDSVRCHQLVLSHYPSTSSRSETLRASASATSRFPQSESLCTTHLELLLQTPDPAEDLTDRLHTFHQAQIEFPGSLRVAELFVQMVQQKHQQKEMSDQEMKDLLEFSLSRAARNTREFIDDSTLSPSSGASSVVETYQRALTECPSPVSRRAFYVQLSNQSTLSLSFLGWATSYETDVLALEDLHTLAITHPRAGLDEWSSYLQFLIKVKRDLIQADAQLVQAKRALGHRLGQVLEERWMKSVGDDQ